MTATIVATGVTSTGNTIVSGDTLTVNAGGTEVSGLILNGGAAIILGVDSGTIIDLGGTETVSGSTNGDAIFGVQLEATAAALVSNETIFNGGQLQMYATSGHAANITVETGGALLLSANAPVDGLVIQGGTVLMESKKSNVTGVTFAGAGTINESVIISAGEGVLGVISGFGASDVLDLSGIGSGAGIAVTSGGGNTTLTVSGGSTEGSGVTESFTLSGIGQDFVLGTDLAGTGSEITLAASTNVNITSANNTIASGQTVSSAYVGSGETLTVLAGGTDLAGTIAGGGMEIINGTASGDLLYGMQLENAATALVSNETIFNGGQLQMYATSGHAANLTVETGGALLLSANAPVDNLVIQGGTVLMESKKSNVTGVTFAGAGTINENVIISAGEGVLGVISGFGAGDVLDLSGIGSGAGIAVTSGGGNTTLAVSGGSTEGSGVTESFTLSGTGQNFVFSADPSGTGSEITISSGGTGGSVTTVASGHSLTGQIVSLGSELLVAPGGIATNVVLSGGLVSLSGTLGGGFTFAAGGTLMENGVVDNGAVISGFGAGDVIDLADIGTGAITSATTAGGNTVLTVSGGSSEAGGVETLTFSGTGTVYAVNTDAAGTGESITAIPMLTSFTAGDIVVGVVGDDNDSGFYGDNQAAPIALEEIEPATGAIIGEMVLSQASSGANSVISGEYGSSSEGILQLSGDGQSLVIGGYGINAVTFNSAPLSVYGDAALAQSTSLTDSSFTPVSRVVADISYNGAVDTSTTLFNVFNTNNIRSVATVDGKTFYVSGQGVKGDATEGVFVAQDGASAATAIDTATDTRTVEIYNGQLYVSQNSSSGTSNIASFGDLPAGPAVPAILSGIDQTVLLTAAQTNTLNAGAVGTEVALSPEQYFFANATTLYVADGGLPKAGTIGDGGLQKWVLDTATGQWNLLYTLSAGLNLVLNTNSSGSTGLIGLTGVLNANGTVTFYATNSTIGDTDQTYLYSITDTVAATSAAGEQFTIVTTASPDSNVRGIAEAPSAPANITIASGVTSAGLNITDGSTLTVLAGGTVSGAVIQSGGAAFVAGQDNGSLVTLGGSETVTGNATGDNIYGDQIVSGSVADETIYYDGAMTLASGAAATAITMQTGSELVVSGAVSGLVISGGIAMLAAATASISGVTFAGAGEIAELSSGGVSGVISGFSVGDIIDLTEIGAGATLSTSVTGGNTIETVTSGGVSQSITLAGHFAGDAIGLAPDQSGGVELLFQGSTVTGTEEITAGEFGALITVANGGTLQVDAGGTVTQDAILTGGLAIIAGLASDDLIAGRETVSAGGSVSSETLAGGTLVLEGAATANDVTASTGTIILEAGATLAGTLALGADVTVDVAEGTSLPALITGFAGADIINLAGFGTGATLSSAVIGGNTVETVTSGGTSGTFSFSGTYSPGYFALNQSASGDSLITAPPITNGFVVTSAGAEGVLGGFFTGPTTTSGLVISSGFVLDELAGGTVTAPIVLNGGLADIAGVENSAVISLGGQITLAAGAIETNATLQAGSTETLIGQITATGDKVEGLQQVTGTSGATLANETIFGGGEVDLFFKTNTLENSTILSGGDLSINGNATGLNLTLAGGTITLESPKANVTGMLSFASGGTLLETDLIDAGFGDLATIQGFKAGDVIELTAIGSGASLTSTLDGTGDDIVTIAGGSNETSPQSFTFTGTSEFALLQIAGGAELLGDTKVISAGETASGGVVSAGYSVLVLSGGTDTGSNILAGGSETVQSGGTVDINSGSNPRLTLDAGSTEIVNAGIGIENALIASGTTLLISGGVDGGVVSKGGAVTVASGGFADFDSIATGGSATVLSGGVLAVLPGQTIAGAAIDGGVAGVIGASLGATVANGGYQLVGAPGFSDNTVIEAGSYEYVLYGGTAFDSTIASGGTMLIGADGKTGGGIHFAGSDAVLSVAGTAMPTATIDGFDGNGATNDAVILTGFTYAAGHDSASYGSNGVLTLNLNGAIEKLQFNAGQNNAGKNFTLTSNSLDQVVVIDPATGSVPNMDFLAPATAAGSTGTMQQVLGRSAGLILDYLQNDVGTSAFAPALKNFAAIDTLNTISSPAAGSSLASLKLPNTVVTLIHALTAHG